jgi:hypothetical protein
MAFSIEYANVFSNILAEEDITISIDQQADTARFNLNTRVLTLPQWDAAHELLRYLLCHEISHAIFTPCREWLEAIESRPDEHQRSYMDVLNVFEDARVDRLMTEKYVAMRQWYAQGNHEFVNVQDLWGIAHDPAKAHDFSLIDRINLYYKTIFLTNPYHLVFPHPDDQWISRTNAARTFAEIKKIADDFFEQMDDAAKTAGSESEPLLLRIGVGDFNVEVTLLETQKDLQGLVKRVTNINPKPPNLTWKEHGTLYVPDSNYKHVLSYFSGTLAKTTAPPRHKNLINKMASVFQRKKNAKLFSRVMTNKTGIIDPLKLYTYKFNNDIMLRKTIVDKQKNHGFIMIVDTSSSMSGVWDAVVEHLYILTLFCKQINVPFEAYGFTDGKNECALTGTKFSLRPFFTSKDSIGAITDILPKIENFDLCGFTPLTSALHYSKTLTLDFIDKNYIDVMNVIFLTDGGCTNSVKAATYIDKKSRFMTSSANDFMGRDTALAPLSKILRHRTGANLWTYFIKSGNTYDFKPEVGGMSGVFTIGTKLLKNNPNIFVNDFVDRMSEFGGKIDTR